VSIGETAWPWHFVMCYFTILYLVWYKFCDVLLHIDISYSHDWYSEYDKLRNLYGSLYY